MNLLNLLTPCLYVLQERVIHIYLFLRTCGDRTCWLAACDCDVDQRDVLKRLVSVPPVTSVDLAAVLRARCVTSLCVHLQAVALLLEGYRVSECAHWLVLRKELAYRLPLGIPQLVVRLPRPAKHTTTDYSVAGDGHSRAVVRQTVSVGLSCVSSPALAERGCMASGCTHVAAVSSETGAAVRNGPRLSGIDDEEEDTVRNLTHEKIVYRLYNGLSIDVRSRAHLGQKEPAQISFLTAPALRQYDPRPEMQAAVEESRRAFLGSLPESTFISL